MRGVQIWHQRHGGDFERYVEEAIERETWSDDRWKAYREDKLARILDRAAKVVPYYQRHWEERRRKGDKSSIELLENWPVLTKEALRQHQDELIASDRKRHELYLNHSSGTTGKAVYIYRTLETVRRYYALFEVRWRLWHGVSRFHRYGHLGGQIIKPVQDNRPPFWVYNRKMNQLYMSTYHMSPENMPLYLDALKRYDIEFMYGYTYMLHVLATGALELGWDDLSFTVSLTNAEQVRQYHRDSVQQAFKGPLRETYGAAEIVVAAGECEYGNMHLWPDVGVVEVMEHGEHVPIGTPGDLVCTTLVNPDMPLIRYEIGDRGALRPPEERCACGRNLPMLDHIEGRANDKLVTSNGRVVFQFDPVVYGLPLKEAQIVQQRIGEVTFKFVPGERWTGDHRKEVDRRLNERLGGVTVHFEETDYIPVGVNGKFRMVLCEVSDEEIARTQKQR